jgi:Kef-type K+ transport system membrane component KefB
VGRSRWRDERALRLVEQLAHGLFAPLFFATAGLRIDLGVFVDRTVATWTLIVVLIASVTKFVGALGGAHLSGLPRREGLALGAALNARGALEIVIASIGLSLGVLNDSSYGVIVVMAIVTSLAAPPLLRSFLADWQGTEEEQRRLEAEQIARSRIIVSDRPPLLLTRGNPP